MAGTANNDVIVRKRYELGTGTKVVEPPPGVTLRRATLADYEGILGISEGVFGNTDYLPAVYQEYTRDPNRHMFVAERNEKVIAFWMGYVVDRGTTFLGEGGRSHPSIRHSGIYGSLMAHGWMEIMKAFPTVQKCRGNMADLAFLETLTKRSKYTTAISIKHYVTITESVGIDDVMKLVLPAFKAKMALHFPLDTIRVLRGRQELVNVLNDSQLVQELFPNNVMLAGMEPLEPRIENIPIMLNGNCCFAMAIDRSSFCSSQFSQSPQGLAVRMKLHGRDVTSMDVMAYVITFLTLAGRYYKRGKVMITIAVPDKTVIEGVKRLCKVLPFCDENTRHPTNYSGTAETQLPFISNI